MKTRSSALVTAHANRVTRPVSLVEIHWSVVVRLSTRGDVVWNGLGWSGSRAVRLEGMTTQGGRLRIDNHDGAYGALLLTERANGITVRVYDGDASATGDADDFKLSFEGIADGFGIDEGGYVTLPLSAQNIHTLTSPRVRIDAAGGFNTLAMSRRIVVGGQVIELEK